MMQNFFRIFKWILLTVFALPLSLYLALFIVNISDVPPSELSKHNLNVIANNDHLLTQNPKDNAYVFALGFDVPKEKSPADEGLNLFKKIKELQDLNLEEQAKTTKMASFERPQLPLANCLNRSDFILACAEKLKQQDKIEALLTENQWLIQRYQKLLNISEWRDSTHHTLYIKTLPLQSIRQAQKLYLIDIYTNSENSAPDSIIRAVEKDMQFWKMLSMGSHTLVSKMVSTHAISTNMQLGEMIFNQLANKQELAALPPSWNVPMSEQILSLENAKLGEWHYFTKTIDSANSVRGITDYLLQPLLQPTDTKNRYAEMLSGSKPNTDCHPSLSINSIKNYLYNPIGKFILCNSTASFDDYQNNLDRLEPQRAKLIDRLELAINSSPNTALN